MCGRFNILTDAEALLTTFEILTENSELAPFNERYNISPSARQTLIGKENDSSLTKIPIVRLGTNNQRQLRDAIWPLVPVWANAKVPKYSTANARSETMTSKPSYRSAWKKGQRCLIPATGFYEWQIVSGQRIKQPWHIYHRDQSLMSFAGLWERGWTDNGDEFESCTIVTTKANELMSTIHNSNYRMPVIIDPDRWDQWLGRDNELAFQLVDPYPNGQLTADPISTRINNPNYDRPDCLDLDES